MSFKNKKKVKNIQDPGLGSDAEKAINSKIKNSMLSCEDAFSLSDELGISKKKIGTFADFKKIRLINCQLGLFGIGPGQKKQVKKVQTVSENLKDKINTSLTENTLTCKDAWQIASELNIKRFEVSNACESMNVKIKNCQLGAF